MSKDAHWKTMRSATSLLCLILEDDHVEITTKLYTTGLFYFCLRACTRETASLLQELLRATHLRQRFPLWQPLPTGSVGRKGLKQKDATALNSSSTSSPPVETRRASGRLLARASVLGTMLPESMLSVLVYGHEDRQNLRSDTANASAQDNASNAFANIFLGDCNDPEVIWTKEMRRHLNNELDEHLSRFRTVLDADPTCLYLFEPIPPVTYDELQHESYCHSYYLNNLCNVRRFPNWRVYDPIVLLRDVLDSWRSEVDVSLKMNQGETMSYHRAAELLGFVPDDTTGVLQITKSGLRKAYLRAALTTHPDRNNGEGKEEFADIHLAYKRLGLVIAGRVDVAKDHQNRNGSDMNTNNYGRNNIVSDRVTMHLLLRVQTLLFRRYPNVLAPVKYPMYQALVEMCGAGRITDVVPMLAMRTLAWVSVAAVGNVKELMLRQGFELVVSALRASSTSLSGGTRETQSRNAQSIRVSSMMATAALMATANGRARMVTCTSMKAALYNVLHHGARRLNGKRRRRKITNAEHEEEEHDEAMLDYALAALHHVAMHGDANARSALVERGCLYPLLRMSLTEDDIDQATSVPSSSGVSVDVSSGGSNDYSGSNITMRYTTTLGKPWSGHPLRRCNVATRILLELAGFRRSGHAIETDTEHEYVREGLNKVLSPPMVRLLARAFAELPLDESSNNSSDNRSNGNRINAAEDLWCGILLRETVSPLLIWDTNMRESVLRFVGEQSFDVVDEDAEALSMVGEKTNTSAALFTRALGPVHGFNHARLEGEPLVGGIYLKPFVYLRHHALTATNSISRTGRNGNGSASDGHALALDGLGVTTQQLSQDLVSYVERATTSSAIVSGSLHADARLTALSAARDHTLGVLYSIRALTTLLSLSESEAGVNVESGRECACQTVALLTHHTTPLFACASGRFAASTILTGEADNVETMQDNLTSAGLELLRAACNIKTNHSGGRGTRQGATGEVFARCAVDASVLWMLLDPLRATRKRSSSESSSQQQTTTTAVDQRLLHPILETIDAFVQCSSVASAHLSGLGVAVDLMWMVSDTDIQREHRSAAFRILTSLISQPSCGSQVRAAVLRMLPSRLLGLMLSSDSERRTSISLSTSQSNTSQLRLGGEATNSQQQHQQYDDAIHIFDSDHDDAELLWTSTCRGELRTFLTSLRAEMLQRTVIGGSHHSTGVWSIPDNYLVRYTEYSSKFVVSSVFVNKFLQDTSVVLSDPQTFAVELLRVLTSEPTSLSSTSASRSVMPAPTVTTQNLSLLIRAFVSLVMQNPELATGVAMSGVTHSLLRRMVDAERDTQLACLSSLTQLVLHSKAAVHQVRLTMDDANSCTERAI